MNIKQSLSLNRWPLFVVGLLGMSVTANAIMVWVATRPSASKPYANYYQRGLAWDADAAIAAASQALGWTVSVDVPSGAELALSEMRPVDVTVKDREGHPVTGLEGRMVASRVADSRPADSSDLVALPQAAGTYRTLARLSKPGLWDLGLDTHLGTQRFVYRTRIDIRQEATR